MNAISDVVDAADAADAAYTTAPLLQQRPRVLLRVYRWEGFVALLVAAIVQTMRLSHGWTSCWACRSVGAPVIAVGMSNCRAKHSWRPGYIGVGWGWREEAAVMLGGKDILRYYRD